MKTIEEVAEICHEMNAAFCRAIGDDSQRSWADAPEWQRESAVVEVQFHLDGDHPASAGHDSWMRQKTAQGWVWGPVKNADIKTHPCMVPFEQLPVEQQAKDYIFAGIVKALKESPGTA